MNKIHPDMFVNKYRMTDLSDVQKRQGGAFTVDVD